MKSSIKQSITTLALLCCAMMSLSALAPGDAHGSLINIDLKTSSGGDAYGPGAAVFGAAGSQWNYQSRSPFSVSTSLNDSLGVGTGVTLTYTKNSSGSDGPTGAYSALGTSHVGTGQVVFSGLVADSYYDLAIFSRTAATFSVAGVTDTQTLSGSPDWSSLVQGSQYVLFSSIKSSDGTLSFTPASGNTWSAVQLQSATAVPEPSTYALLGISLGVVGYARRRMTKGER